MGNVLVSPMSWGLGHATRTIPVIRELLKHGHEVTIATSDDAKELLKKEFPDCIFINLEGYPIPLTSNKHYIMKLILSIPNLFDAIKKEKRNVDLLLSKKKYDLIISDNRFGVYSKNIPSFLITHQVRFSVPVFLRFADIFTQLFNSYYHKHFERVIVPDNNPEFGCLSGSLCQSNIPLTKKKIYFAGILGSIRKLKIKENVDFLISISGPEPQRTKFEEILLKQVTSLPGKKIVLLGKPEDDFESKLDNNTLIKSYATRREMSLLMNRAKFIISRSGYTTMMEIVELEKKKGLFIPTPGQPEQEYLSRYCRKKGWFYSKSQYKINLIEDIKEAKKYNGFPKMPKFEQNARKLYEKILAPHFK